MLTTAKMVSSIPGFANLCARPVEWVNALIGAADASIRQYCKRDFELTSYLEYKDGSGTPDLVLRQTPVWSCSTYLDASMNGVALPQATLTVSSTSGFHPGTFGNSNIPAPAIAVCTGINSWTTVTYTGTTSTTFTGCSGGSGTMATNPGSATVTPYSVASPVVQYNAAGGAGQNAVTWTQLIPGIQYYVLTDTQGQGGTTPLPNGVQASKRGLIRNGGWAGSGWGGWGGSSPGTWSGGKLAGSRLPYWPFTQGGLRVMYNAGFLTVPFDLSYAAAMLVCQMTRIQPSGTNLQNEGLNQYSYGVLVNGENPEMGEIRRVLARYRESSWAMNY